MHLETDRGVHLEERRRVALGSLRDWDAARVFLEVARCGSFRSAAERLGLSINAVRRRVGEFERQIGAVTTERMLAVAARSFDPARRVEGIVRGTSAPR